MTVQSQDARGSGRKVLRGRITFELMYGFDMGLNYHGVPPELDLLAIACPSLPDLAGFPLQRSRRLGDLVGPFWVVFAEAFISPFSALLHFLTSYVSSNFRIILFYSSYVFPGTYILSSQPQWIQWWTIFPLALLFVLKFLPSPLVVFIHVCLLFAF